MYKNIVVGIDPTAETRGAEALRTATHLAEDANSVITAVTVLEAVPGYFKDHLAREAEKRAGEAAMARLRNLTGPNSEVRTEIRHGKAAEELLKFVETSGADCIVIASHKPGIGDYFLGSTAARVVRHAGCSVHVIR